MLKGRGNAPNIVCPLHRWTYDLQGRAPRRAAFRRQPVPQPRPHRRSRTGTASCSTARATSRATSRASACKDFDFSGYVLDRVEIASSATTTGRSFIEVYLEDYHVGPFHPGLGQFVTCDDLQLGVRRLVFGADGRRQQRARKTGHARSTSAGTRRCSTSIAARFRRTARSGSRTTRTSCSSGIRTCS